MLTKRHMITALLFAQCFTFSGLTQANDCANTISEHIQWLNNNPANKVLFTKRTTKYDQIKSNTIWKSIAKGNLQAANNNRHMYNTDIKVTFSDRNNYAKDKADLEALYLYSTGEIKLVLKSWGNRVVPFGKIKCQNNRRIIAIEKSLNNPLKVTIALKKYSPVHTTNSSSRRNFKCGLRPKVDQCGNKANLTGYYFNNKSQKCDSFAFNGCWDNSVVPFETASECVNACEIP